MGSLIRKRRQKAEVAGGSSWRWSHSSKTPNKGEARRPRLIDSSTSPPSPTSIVQMCRHINAGSSPSVQVRTNLVGQTEIKESVLKQSRIQAGSAVEGSEAGLQSDAGEVSMEWEMPAVGCSLMKPSRTEVGTSITASISSFNSIDLQNFQPIGYNFTLAC